MALASTIVAITIDSCPVTINDSSALITNVVSPGACITINASHVVLDCAQFAISYDAAGTGGNGIIADGLNNLTVKNCFIQDINSNAADGYGINFTAVNNSIIVNNTIFTNGTTRNNGIRLRIGTRNVTIINNSIRTTGSGSSNDGILLAATSFENRMIKNVIVANGSGFNRGIVAAFSDNNTIENNTIHVGGIATTFGTVAFGNNIGIMIDNSDGNNLTGNRINTSGPAHYNYAIHVRGGSQNNRVISNILHGTSQGFCCPYGIHLHSAGTANNTIAFNSVTTNSTFGPHGIVSQAGALDNLIENNSVIVRHRDDDNDAGALIVAASSGTVVSRNMLDSSHYGLRLDYSVILSNFTDNSIRTQGNSSDNVGITLSSSTNNTFTRNAITTNGTNASHGIRIIDGSHDNTFIANNITTSGSNSYAVFIDDSNNSVFSEMVFNDSSEWLRSGNNVVSKLANTTFVTAFGKLDYLNILFITGSFDITPMKLNISYNRVFVNSSNLTFLNTSAQITLFNAPKKPKPIVDFEDDGTFIDCPITICTGQSPNGNSFVFNVTHFTTYSSVKKLKKQK